MFKKIIKSKVLYLALAVLIQLAALMLVATFFAFNFMSVYIFMIVLSVIACIFVINRDSDSSSKLLWVLIIMIMPFFGGFLYLLFGGRKIPKALMIQDRQAYSDYRKYAMQNMKLLSQNDHPDPVLKKMTNMAWNNGYFPVYTHNKTRYFKTGAEQYETLLDALKEAEKFIFIETYIIDKGEMWDSIHEILREKVAQGVDVRLVFDDFGSILNVDDEFVRKLNEEGIKTHPFNRIRPQLAVQMNNRDHRKIIVIDGKKGFTGGSNIADEYINKVERFGYWKDMGMMVEGSAVEPFTISFLQIWNYSSEKNTPYEEFVLPPGQVPVFNNEPGFVLPFSDSPTDEHNLGKSMHLNMLAGAMDYCWISTPYLILDDEMENALLLAVNNGVDVRIVVPGIPDKKIVYEVTKANIEHLVKKGVRVYEYTPGFIHGKVTLADGKQGLVGTVNMDFRSYYYNYECGTWMYETECLKDIHQDFEEIFADSREVTMEDLKSINPIVRYARNILKVFSPLL